MSRSTRFRELLRSPPFVCLGAHDAVTAKLAERAGAPAIYVSGFVASAIVAGAPDFETVAVNAMQVFTRGGTEYRLSWIPLGGYVKLRGESAPEDGRAPEPGDMMSHSRLQRFIVFVMGAVFNLATAFGLTTLIFMKGVPEFSFLYEAPVVGEVDPDSPARLAGIQPGDRLVARQAKRAI